MPYHIIPLKIFLFMSRSTDHFTTKITSFHYYSSLQYPWLYNFLSQSLLNNATKVIFLKYQFEYIIALLKNCLAVAHRMKSELLIQTNRKQIMADFQLPCSPISQLCTKSSIPAKWFFSQTTEHARHTPVSTILLTPSLLPNKPVSIISIYISPNFPSKPSSFTWQTISQCKVQFWMKEI